MIRIGLISDTHDLLRPEAIAFLQGSDFIVHAGDVCEPCVLDALRLIAPVTAVRGNNDTGPWAEQLKETEVLRSGSFRIYVIHDLAQMNIDPRGAGIHAVVSGHSHRPLVVERDGVLYVNPGSAGRRRFKLPISVGEIIIDGESMTARTATLPLPQR